MTTNKRKLNSTEIWNIAAKALHTDDYVEKYINALSFVIRDKNLSILDTASGSGFPTTDLYKAGFTNITASDADQKSVELLQKSFNDLGMPITVSEGMWQELADKIKNKFDVVLNADNSLVYMDGWSDNNIVSGTEKVFGRISLVLKNFYDVLNDGGLAIVGLGKHYHPENVKYTRDFDHTENGEEIKIKWDVVMDWQTRNQDWLTTIDGKTMEGSILRKNYLITKDELATLMKNAGFKSVHIFEPDGTRDNLIIGVK